MRKISIAILASLLLLVGCSNKDASNDGGKIKVITSLFPQYDFVREIAKDKVEVTLLLPPGVESHSFDPTPSQIISITQSDLFIYTNKDMEPWIDKIVENVKGQRPIIVESSLGVSYIQGDHTHSHDDNEHSHDEEEHDHDEEEHDHEETLVDPHVWLDPLNAKIMVNNIVDSLVLVDPDNKDFYQENANQYLESLDALDQAFKTLFESTENDTIIYGGHFAFGYLADRFDLTILSPYTGFSPDSEPTASAISELIETIKEKNITVIFYEELIDPRVARVISSQTNTKAMLLHGAHNLTPQEMSDQTTYLDLMYENIDKLKEALSYE